MTITLPWSPSPNFTPGRPNQIQCLVMHSTESPMQVGIAKSLAGPNWFGKSSTGTSANAIFDPSGGVEMVKPGDRAWHVGGGNDYTYGTEHCGYAAFTAEQWLTDDGKKMLTASALWNRQIAAEQGIPWVRLTVDEIKAGRRGLCTHNDCRQVWGGTTHTDPQWADEVWDFYLAAGAGETGSTTQSPTPPTEQDLVTWMASNEETVQQIVRDELKAALGNDYAGATPSKVVASGPISSRTAVKVRDMKYEIGRAHV